MNLFEHISVIITNVGEESVHDCLDRVFKRENVQIENFTPDEYNFQSMYAICTNREIMVVAIDHSWPLPCATETASDTEYPHQNFVWDSEGSSRKSPAYALHEIVVALKEKCKLQIGLDILEVHGILITGSTLSNNKEVVDFWYANGITIKESVSNPQNYLFASRCEQPFDTCAADLIRDFANIAKPEPLEDEDVDDDIELDDDNDNNDDDDDNDPFEDFTFPWQSEQPLSAQVLPCLENPERELEALVGLRSIKDHIQKLISLNEYNKKLRSLDPLCQTHTINLHGCFLGGVGTGKTTVARLMGALFAKAGMLSKGHVVVADRRTFIGRQFGCEEENVQKCVNAAKGGVLLIDEAYLLVGNHHEDPGQMVIQMMLSLLADEKNRDIAVLLCGYEKEMQRIFDLNPGIVSRFPNIIKFPNYTLPELLEIARRRIKQYSYTLTPRAWQRFADALSSKMKGNVRNWANAREVANLLEQVYVQHAQRCCAQNVPAAAMRRITAADIPSPTPSPRPRLGF